jgi:hypothetical protein
MRILGELVVCNETYTVKLGVAGDYSLLDKAYGVADIVTHTLWIHEGMAPEKMVQTITHEAVHALLAESGAMSVIELAGIADTQNLEEALVRVLTPHISTLFGPPQLRKVSNAGRRK